MGDDCRAGIGQISKAPRVRCTTGRRSAILVVDKVDAANAIFKTEGAFQGYDILTVFRLAHLAANSVYKSIFPVLRDSSWLPRPYSPCLRLGLMRSSARLRPPSRCQSLVTLLKMWFVFAFNAPMVEIVGAMTKSVGCLFLSLLWSALLTTPCGGCEQCSHHEGWFRSPCCSSRTCHYSHLASGARWA